MGADENQTLGLDGMGLDIVVCDRRGNLCIDDSLGAMVI